MSFSSLTDYSDIIYTLNFVYSTILTALGRFAFGHNKYLKPIAAAYCKPQSNSLLNSLPSLAHLKGPSNVISSQIGPLLRIGNDSTSLVRDGRVSTSSPLATSGIMHGSPLSDDSSQHSDSGILNDGVSNGVVNHSTPKPLDSAIYSKCVLAMCTLAKDPSPRIASLGRRVLAIIGIEQVVAKPVKISGSSVQPGEPSTATPFAGLARSSSWFDMNGGKFLCYGITSITNLFYLFFFFCHQPRGFVMLLVLCAC